MRGGWVVSEKVNALEQLYAQPIPEPQQCPFCGVQRAKPSGIPPEIDPRLLSPGPTHHLMRAESAGAAGAGASLAAAAGEEEEPKGGATGGWTPVAGGATAPPATQKKENIFYC